MEATEVLTTGPDTAANSDTEENKLQVDAGILEKMLKLWTANYNEGFSKIRLNVAQKIISVGHFDDTAAMGIIGHVALGEGGSVTAFDFGVGDPQRLADYLKMCGGPVSITLANNTIEIQGSKQKVKTGVIDAGLISSPKSDLVKTIIINDGVNFVFSQSAKSPAVQDYLNSGYQLVKVKVSELSDVVKAISALSKEGRNRNLVSHLAYDAAKGFVVKTQEASNATADLAVSVLEGSTLMSKEWKPVSLLSVYLFTLWSSLSGLANDTELYILKHPDEPIVNMFCQSKDFSLTQIIGVWEEN